jgi:hypothetical protein
VSGHARTLAAEIVSYADDFVICCRGSAEQAMAVMRRMMARLRLTVNDRKTRICRVSDETFRFLGYTIGPCYSPWNGQRYLAPRPSRQAVQKLCRIISGKTSRRWLSLEPEFLVRGLHLHLRGWVNYFQLGQVSKAYRAVDHHVRYRLRRWLCAKYRIPWASATTRFTDQYLARSLGLLTLGQLRQKLRAAKA